VAAGAAVPVVGVTVAGVEGRVDQRGDDDDERDQGWCLLSGGAVWAAGGWD
jgi:hypothetical protein